MLLKSFLCSEEFFDFILMCVLLMCYISPIGAFFHCFTVHIWVEHLYAQERHCRNSTEEFSLYMSANFMVFMAYNIFPLSGPTVNQ